MKEDIELQVRPCYAKAKDASKDTEAETLAPLSALQPQSIGQTDLGQFERIRSPSYHHSPR
jgi:hypothetical protein